MSTLECCLLIDIFFYTFVMLCILILSKPLTVMWVENKAKNLADR